MIQETVHHTIWKDGATFRFGDRKYHIVTHHHDTDTGRLVYLLRWYGQRQQWWHYLAWDAQELDWNESHGLIKYIANK